MFKAISKFLKNYAEKLEIIRGFNNFNEISLSLAEHAGEWNLEERNVPIFLSIQYLTQNDMLKRDKKVERLEKRHVRELTKEPKKTVPNKPINNTGLGLKRKVCVFLGSPQPRITIGVWILLWTGKINHNPEMELLK